MRAVLGIDAAWTEGEPSGVALAVEEHGRWRCRALAPSYGTFSALARDDEVPWAGGPIRGGAPDPGTLLRDVAALAPGAEVAVIAVDMPLARGPIVRRRAADDACSRVLGAMGCGVHSPTPDRPGPVAERLRDGFLAGPDPFVLSVARQSRRANARRRELIEVYPHAAVMALLGERYRVPYKLARSGRYWPGALAEARARNLLAAWRRILARLERDLPGAALPLPRRTTSLAHLKRYEDALDALVCAWIGVEHLGGRTVPVGDAEAAIWLPRALLEPGPTVTSEVGRGG